MTPHRVAIHVDELVVPARSPGAARLVAEQFTGELERLVADQAWTPSGDATASEVSIRLPIGAGEGLGHRLAVAVHAALSRPEEKGS